MTENLEVVYNDINHLLKDICQFLTTQIQNGTMSNEAQAFAQKLVKRSEEKVAEIKQISIGKSDSYLDMGRPETTDELYVDPDGDLYEDTNVPEVEEYDMISAEVTDIKPVSTPTKPDCCPYFESPFFHLSHRAIKTGFLYRKERRFIIDQKKEIFLSLVDHWLLAYYPTKKNIKPFLTININECNAAQIKEKKDPFFEILINEKMKHEFIARSHKEMEQWIAIINNKKFKNYGKIYVRNLPEIPSESVVDSASENEYQFGSDRHSNSSEISDIYDMIYENVEHSGTALNKKPEAPPLPTIKASEVVEELVEYDQILHGDDFEEEEDIYDDPSELIQANNELSEYHELTAANGEEPRTEDIEYNEIAEEIVREPVKPVLDKNIHKRPLIKPVVPRPVINIETLRSAAKKKKELIQANDDSCEYHEPTAPSDMDSNTEDVEYNEIAEEIVCKPVKPVLDKNIHKRPLIKPVVPRPMINLETLKSAAKKKKELIQANDDSCEYHEPTAPNDMESNTEDIEYNEIAEEIVCKPVKPALDKHIYKRSLIKPVVPRPMIDIKSLKSSIRKKTELIPANDDSCEYQEPTAPSDLESNTEDIEYNEVAEENVCEPAKSVLDKNIHKRPLIKPVVPRPMIDIKSLKSSIQKKMELIPPNDDSCEYLEPTTPSVMESYTEDVEYNEVAEEIVCEPVKPVFDKTVHKRPAIKPVVPRPIIDIKSLKSPTNIKKKLIPANDDSCEYQDMEPQTEDVTYNEVAEETASEPVKAVLDKSILKKPLIKPVVKFSKPMTDKKNVKSPPKIRNVLKPDLPAQKSKINGNNFNEKKQMLDACLFKGKK